MFTVHTTSDTFNIFLNSKILRFKFGLKMHSKAFDDFKNKQKNVWSNVFWYVKVCIFWNWFNIQYTIYWDKTQMLRKFPLDKIKGTKNALFFLSGPPTYHSFIFHLRFLYELKLRFVSLKLRVRFSIFDSILFLLKFLFFFNKMHGLFHFKTS